MQAKDQSQNVPEPILQFKTDVVLGESKQPPGELEVPTLGIKMQEYANRRQTLLKRIPPFSIVILPAGEQKFRNADASYLFRQQSHFYYLTGFCEPEALLILLKEQEGNSEFILFCKQRNREEEIWTGRLVGQEEAMLQFGANRAYALEELDKIMPMLFEGKQNVVYSLGTAESWDKRVMQWLNVGRAKQRLGVKSPFVWLELLPFIDEQRLIKSSAEIALMRQAARISAKAHLNVMRACKPNKKEYELEGVFIQECYKEGCREMAYTPIVAGGGNACTLHYIRNDQPLKAGELVLVDAGCEYQYYAADITRTIPINGEFSKDQKLIYECVLKAQICAIQAIKPGITWDRLQEIIVKVLVEGLVSLGILHGDVETLVQEKAYKRFYMHSSGHWLGLDVHDVGEYKIEGEWRPLVAGMVLTVEPGLYIWPAENVDKRWWGIGVRIEDDVLVTDTSFEVLSQDVPKTVKEIEQLMAGGNGF